MNLNRLLFALALFAAGTAVGREAPVLCNLQPEKASITLGEPLLLTLSCRNSAASEAQLDLATGDGLVWIVSPAGGAAVRVPEKARISRPSPKVVLIAAGKEGEVRAPLGRWYRFPEPGTYRVAALVRDPLGRSAGVETREIEVEVRPRAPERLRAAAEGLLQKASQAPPGEAELAAEALASMDDPLVLPLLAEALRQRVPGTAHVVDGLARMGTREAVLALVDAFETAAPFDRLRIQERLRELVAGIEDPELRQRAGRIVESEAIRLVPQSR